MKKFIIIILISFITQAAFCKTAPDQKNGVGIILGEPTGATVKYWKNQNRALDAGLAFSFHDYMIFYSDYLFQLPAIDLKNNEHILPYVGIGGEILFSTYSRRDGRGYYRDRDRDDYYQDRDTSLGIRIPVGVEWIISTYPIGLFAELVPGIAIIPDAFGFLQGGIGGRYYF